MSPAVPSGIPLRAPERSGLCAHGCPDTDSCTSRQSGAVTGSWCPVPAVVVAVSSVAVTVCSDVVRGCWDRVVRPREPGTRIRGSFCTVPRTACQFPRSWSIGTFSQVRAVLAGALSSLCNRRAAGPGKHPCSHPTAGPPHLSPTAGAPRRALALTVDRAPVQRVPGPGPRTHDPVASRRARLEPRRNGCAPGSGGAAGSRGRRRPLVPRSRATSEVQALTRAWTTARSGGGLSVTGTHVDRHPTRPLRAPAGELWACARGGLEVGRSPVVGQSAITA